MRIAVLFSLLLIQISQSACADSKGEFPGTGDYSAWKQAVESSEDGIDYARKGNYTMAMQCYDEAIQLYPYDASFFFNKATALKKKDRAKEAIEFFKKAVELEPKYASAWYNMGNAYGNLHDMFGAEDAYQHAITLDPRHMKAWFNLGECLFNRKKYTEAQEAFNKANELPGSEQDKKDIAQFLSEIARLQKKKSD